jgi:hypothetical protein
MAASVAIWNLYRALARRIAYFVGLFALAAATMASNSKKCK